CNDDAYTAMDTFRKTAGPDANLQTLARGINIVALDSQPRDIVNLHAVTFKKHGITTIRNFDALNDVNNLIYSGKCIVDAGLQHEVVVTMMALPPGMTGAHTPEFYAETLRKIIDSGIKYNSVCFKDASGTSTPQTVYETMKKARAMLPSGTKIAFHSHDTAGTCVTQYRAALDGGADQLDLSMAPVSGGTCQPDIISMWHASRGTDYDLGIDIDKMLIAEEVFKDCMKDYFVPPEAKAVEPLIPFSPMPGGALTANTQMLRDNNQMDKYPEIIKNMKEVVSKGGFGTSVTPVSQFYFQQAFNNTMFGPWKKIAEGYGKMVLGYFGKTPVTPDPEVVKISAEQLKRQPTTENPLDINDRDQSKGINAAKKMLQSADITDLSDENIFIAAACKEKGIAFLKGQAKVNIRLNEKKEEKPALAATSKTASASGYTVTINEKKYSVSIKGGNATVNGKTYTFNVKEGLENAAAPAASMMSAGSTEVKSPLPGLVLRLSVNVGDTVASGEELLVLEAMKMETPVNSPCSGIVTSINVNQSDQVNPGHLLITLNNLQHSAATDNSSENVTSTASATTVKKGSETSVHPAASAAPAQSANSTNVSSPLPGLVLRFSVNVGDTVASGEELLVLEAMKMETPINSPCSGTVTSINVDQGDQVNPGHLLLTIN
ncbi:MAG TPA: biotin/lipoyl-containing protein, partial [Chitinispirillaceae bacterium]|nr:biotin/lipoyl-containing protein [Chitinispirillaceae bacterium]